MDDAQIRRNLTGARRLVLDVISEAKPVTTSRIEAAWAKAQPAMKPRHCEGIPRMVAQILWRLENLEWVTTTADGYRITPELAALVHDELIEHGVDLHTNTTVRSVEKTDSGLVVHAERLSEPVSHTADLLLAVVGVRPNTALLEDAGAQLGAGRAAVVDEQMRTGIPHVFAAGDGDGSGDRRCRRHNEARSAAPRANPRAARRMGVPQP
jgi:NADPH-dependent 2,4-dienoyl-CoA reductase/sulfur reductase-like enzyme